MRNITSVFETLPLAYARGSVLTALLLWCGAAGFSQPVQQAAIQKIQAGDFQSAKRMLVNALKSDAKQVELWNLLGIAEGELKEPKEAQAAFEHGLRLAPDAIALNENLGLLYFKQANYPAAQKYLARAVKLGSEKPAVRFSLAAAELRNGQARQALDLLKQLEAPLRNLSEYWDERGMAELANNSSAAAESFERALNLAPGDLRALNGEAWAAERQGLGEKALAVLLKARKANPDDVGTLLHFAMVCLRRDLGVDALDAAKRAFELQPSNNSALYVLARTHIALENWQQAYNLFDQYSKRLPNFPLTYYAMGWLDIKLNRTEDARRQLQHCLALAPQLADARYELAQLELDDGQLDSAEQLLREVLRQEPNHAKANVAMGDLMMRKGRLDEAEQYLENAVKQDPKLSSAHYKLSALLFRKHENAEGQKERLLAASLAGQAEKASKVQLRLAMPENETTQ